MEDQIKKQPKKGKGKKILIGLGITAASAIAGFFGWNYFAKKKLSISSDEVPQSNPDAAPANYAPAYSPAYSPPSTTIKRTDDFPLKKGSRGERVKRIQELMLSKYGKTILPKYGADGDFGSEMQAALTKLGFKTEIDESTYNVITSASAPDYSTLANRLYTAAVQKTFVAALDSLKKVRNVQDYSAVSEVFKTYRFPDTLVRKTLVTGMLDTFKTSTQSDAIRKEFLRMGLKYDGSKWALSGLVKTTIITTHTAEVFDPQKNSKVTVPAKMVLGYFIKESQGWVMFSTMDRGRKLIVESNKVKFYA
jgi:hypothetical protein